MFFFSKQEQYVLSFNLNRFVCYGVLTLLAMEGEGCFEFRHV